MAMHNMQLSHMMKAPCRMCKKPTKALVHGIVQRHPVCTDCKTELDRQFRVATLVRGRSVR